MSATTTARERDSDAAGDCPVPVREGDRFVEHATDAVLTVVEIVEHEQSADVRIESERPRRPVVRYRMLWSDIRNRVGSGIFRRLPESGGEDG